MMHPPPLQIQLPHKLIPLFKGDALYRGAYGGRGSGKTRSFAKMSAVWGMLWGAEGIRGIIGCGRQFLNSIDESSFAEVKAAILEEPSLAAYYECGDRYIKSRDGLIEYAFVGLKRNVDSLKSKSRLLLLWIDEAEAITEDVWIRVDPTIREAGAELWLTWNPARDSRKEADGTITGSATDWRWRKNPPPQAKIIELNWRDNPWFKKTILPFKRANDERELEPDQYEHVWEGGYVKSIAGAYYARALAQAKKDDRITEVTRDPLLTVQVHCDIGGTGRLSDAFTMIISQWVGTTIRILNAYEAVGQQAADHIHWLERSGYGIDQRVRICLPHDGVQHDKTVRATYKSTFEDAGYRNVHVFPDHQAGIARMRIEQAKRLFPSMFFDAKKTEILRTALGWYHEKIDTDRSVGLGPDHDWSSHLADAFGLLAMDYQPPRAAVIPDKYQRQIDRAII